MEMEGQDENMLNIARLFFPLLLQAYNINWQNTEYKLHYHKIKTLSNNPPKGLFRQKLATNSTKVTQQHKAFKKM